MEFTIHNEVLSIIFVTALIMGAVVNKTNFCTMGAVSDWVNMGDKGRLRAWLLAIAVAMAGVLIMEAMGVLIFFPLTVNNGRMRSSVVKTVSRIIRRSASLRRRRLGL